jgi:hypothetical protein
MNYSVYKKLDEGKRRRNHMTDEQKNLVLEAVQHAIDGMITDREMVRKIEKITGGKIEDHEGVFGAAA